MTAVFESILSQLVSSDTQGNYFNHNVKIVLWIYEREEWRDELVRDWMVDRLIDAEEKGKKETCATCKADLLEVKKIN